MLVDPSAVTVKAMDLLCCCEALQDQTLKMQQRNDSLDSCLFIRDQLGED